MKRRFRKYKRRLRKKLLILSTKLTRLFYKASRPSVTHGNKVAVIKSGNEAFETLLNLIYNSQYYILLEYYIFKDDKYGRIIADALIEKAKNGVKIYLIYDFIGCRDVKKLFFSHLEKNGINVLPFNPIKLFSNPLKWDRRDHRKLAVFDGVKAIVSGWNIAKEYFTTGENAMSDFGLLVEGAVVRALQKMFINVYETQKKVKIKLPTTKIPFEKGEDEVWVLESGPTLKIAPVYNAYRLAIMAAKKSVWLANAYFVPPKRLRKTLINAAKRMVDVKILLPDKIDVPFVKYASYNYYEALLKSGIKILERSKMILHSKVAIVDDIWITIGSTNLHPRSLRKNYELNLVVISKKLGTQLKEILQEDFENSKNISLEAWQNRPFEQRIKEKIASVFSFLL